MVWYAGIISLVVLSLLAVTFAAVVDIGPKVGFALTARRCRCRLLAVRTDINRVDPLGAERSIFHIELVTPPELSGTRLIATYRPSPGIGHEYSHPAHARRELRLFQIGSEYDCWVDPKRPHRAAMVQRPSFALGGTFGILGLAGLALAVLLWTGVVTVIAR